MSAIPSLVGSANAPPKPLTGEPALGGSEAWSDTSSEISPNASPALGHAGAPAPKPDPVRLFPRCRLPNLTLIRNAWEARTNNERLRDDLFVEMASQVVRPFSQASGCGFSSTQFKMDEFYRPVIMKQEDIWVPWMGSGNTATLRTLYEIGHTLRHADVICRHC
ncbi:hypothetical protein B0T25DRAFT_581903 [Lasiosphaeria hispida]|uniref:Uncharacterized protein n=1 Tax=Lasiosphaeria hispida TaxID=260671 RepID=A0AAJ0HE45_9PEZI|nr:hypothetical protein B0T25DRAFT_581903 [Lasiosphaeria hispida]